MFKLLPLLFFAASAEAQSIAIPWTGHGHDPQHTGLSKTTAQPLQQIRWQTLVDRAPVYWSNSLLVHYGSPLITPQNTVLLPVKTGADDFFEIEGRAAADGGKKWTLLTDYSLPAHGWVPSCGIALTPKNRLWYPGIAGSVYYRDNPDAASGPGGQIFFYGLEQYQVAPQTYNANVKINTPITSDRYGNVYFGFIVTASTPLGLSGGIARIAEDGSASWIAANAAADDPQMYKVVQNCAPALSNDQKSLYLVVSDGDYGNGYLVRLNSQTLATISKTRLFDVISPQTYASLPDDGTASPTVGPDGDVYFGVFAAAPFNYNHYRGWLLHFDATLAQTKPSGAFGWDDTASIVPASLVPSYTGASSYLLMTKYNNYVGGGGDGRNKLALLDPNATMTDPITGAAVMQEILTILSPTHDADYPSLPNAVREWCINTAAIDPAKKSAFVGCEDGKLYRWDFTTNTLAETITLTNGIGEAYTPTMIGVDGTVYAIANGILFAIGGTP